MWITPKTDWTADDCLDLATDFTRIEGNIHEILLIVRAAGYTLTLPEKLTWTMQDFLTASHYNRIVSNVGLLEDIVIVPAGLPALSTKADKAVLDYTDMIALETHIAALKDVVDGTTRLYIKSGTAQSGARPLLPV